MIKRTTALLIMTAVILPANAAINLAKIPNSVTETSELKIKTKKISEAQIVAINQSNNETEIIDLNLRKTKKSTFISIPEVDHDIKVILRLSNKKGEAQDTMLVILDDSNGLITNNNSEATSLDPMLGQAFGTVSVVEGKQGVQGEAGSPGPIGPQGPQGNKGPKGAKGDKGAAGKNLTGVYKEATAVHGISYPVLACQALTGSTVLDIDIEDANMLKINFNLPAPPGEGYRFSRITSSQTIEEGHLLHIYFTSTTAVNIFHKTSANLDSQLPDTIHSPNPVKGCFDNTPDFHSTYVRFEKGDVLSLIRIGDVWQVVKN